MLPSHSNSAITLRLINKVEILNQNIKNYFLPKLIVTTLVCMLYHLNTFSSHVVIFSDRVSKPQNTSVIQKSVIRSKKMQMRPEQP